MSPNDLSSDDPSPDGSFTRLLHEAAASAPIPAGDFLAGGALRRGRRRRTRQRAALAGGAAVLVLGGIAAVQLPQRHGGASAATSHKETITGPWMRQALISVLPPGKFTAGQWNGVAAATKLGSGPNGAMTFTDRQGTVNISAGADRVPLPLTATTLGTHCPDSFYTSQLSQSCLRTVRPDGSVLMITKDPAVVGSSSYLNGPGTMATWTAVHTRTDGRQIEVIEYFKETRENLPLTVAQLTTAATSSVWDPVFKANWQGTNEARVMSQANPAAGGPSPTAAEILTRAEALLPPNVGHHDGATQETPGSAHFSVTSGGRTSTVKVEVDPLWLQPGATDQRSRFESAAKTDKTETLTHTADGSSVITYTSGLTQKPGGLQEKLADLTKSSGVTWTVEVLTANGTRIIVTEWNGTSGTEHPKGTPVLTLDQLKSIATAPVWSK